MGNAVLFELGFVLLVDVAQFLIAYRNVLGEVFLRGVGQDALTRHRNGASHLGLLVKFLLDRL